MVVERGWVGIEARAQEPAHERVLALANPVAEALEIAAARERGEHFGAELCGVGVGIDPVLGERVDALLLEHLHEGFLRLAVLDRLGALPTRCGPATPSSCDRPRVRARPR